MVLSSNPPDAAPVPDEKIQAFEMPEDPPAPEIIWRDGIPAVAAEDEDDKSRKAHSDKRFGAICVKVIGTLNLYAGFMLSGINSSWTIVITVAIKSNNERPKTHPKTFYSLLKSWEHLVKALHPYY